VTRCAAMSLRAATLYSRAGAPRLRLPLRAAGSRCGRRLLRSRPGRMAAVRAVRVRRRGHSALAARQQAKRKRANHHSGRRSMSTRQGQPTSHIRDKPLAVSFTKGLNSIGCEVVFTGKWPGQRMHLCQVPSQRTSNAYLLGVGQLSVDSGSSRNTRAVSVSHKCVLTNARPSIVAHDAMHIKVQAGNSLYRFPITSIPKRYSWQANCCWQPSGNSYSEVMRWIAADDAVTR
jgi:hypothetical protein